MHQLSKATHLVIMLPFLGNFIINNALRFYIKVVNVLYCAFITNKSFISLCSGDYMILFIL